MFVRCSDRVHHERRRDRLCRSRMPQRCARLLVHMYLSIHSLILGNLFRVNDSATVLVMLLASLAY